MLEGIVGDAALQNLVAREQARKLLRGPDHLAGSSLQGGGIGSELVQATLDAFRVTVSFLQMRAHLGAQLRIVLEPACLLLQDLDRLVLHRVRVS